MSINKFIFLFFVLFLSKISLYGYHSVIIENDFDENVRNWLYKMQPYFSSNEDIQKNKIFYEVIIEKRLMRLKHDLSRNNYLIFPSGIFGISLMMIMAIITLSQKTSERDWAAFITFGLPSAFVGAGLLWNYDHEKKKIERDLEYNEQVLVALKNS